VPVSQPTSSWIFRDETSSLVLIEDVAEAEHIFSVLMGEKVEPRRAFIEQHALEVRNLDV
jgi:DNA gyrase subunit B